MLVKERGHINLARLNIFFKKISKLVLRICLYLFPKNKKKPFFSIWGRHGRRHIYLQVFLFFVFFSHLEGLYGGVEAGVEVVEEVHDLPGGGLGADGGEADDVREVDGHRVERLSLNLVALKKIIIITESL